MTAARTWFIASMLAMAVGCSKPSADELFAKGNAFVDQGLLAEAVVQYRLAAQADPRRGDVRQKLADVYLRQHDGPLALRESVNAADLLPGDVKAQLLAGNLLLLANAFEDARERARNALAIEPTNSDALVLLGNALAGLKDLDGALAEYQEALVLNPQGEQAFANIGAIQYSRGQTREAEATFRKAVEAAPKSVALRLALANFLWASARPSEAEREMQTALQLDPANLLANRTMGAFYLATGRGAEAEPFFKAVAAAVNDDRAQLALADYYIVVGKTDEAAAVLTPLSRTEGTFEPASVRLAAIQASRNNRTGAASIVQSILAKSPRYAPARLLQLDLLVADGRLDEALTEAAALVRDEGDSPAAVRARLLIGRIETDRDRTEQALEAFTEALRSQPKSIGAALALAQLHLRMGNADLAAQFARQVLELQAGNVAARAVLVRAYLVRNEPARASAELASLEREFPNALPVLNLKAARDVAAGRADSARATYLKVVAARPGDLEALDGLVTLDLRAGRPKDAVDRVEDALKRQPPGTTLLLIAARAHEAAGNGPRAEQLLQQAIERDPSRLAAYGQLGGLYLRLNRLPDARDQFVELTKRNPRSVSANTMLGMILEAQGDTAGAERQYEATLALDPFAAVASNNLAWIYVSSGRSLDQAQRLAEAALKQLPEEPHVNDTLGWIYYHRDMGELAVSRLELSVQRDGSDPASHYHLGMAYLLTGQKDKARAALQKALAMNQAFVGVEEARAALANLNR